MELNKILECLAESFEKAKIPYMVVGGQAVLVYGEPRLTNDVDFNLGIGPQDADKLLNIGKELGLNVLVKEPYEFVIRNYVLPMADPESGLRMDFIFGITDYEKIAIARAKDISIENRMVKYCSKEDLIIFKMIAARPRDIEDVKSILLKNDNVDKPYIIKWLKVLSVDSENNYFKSFNDLLT
ncbi:MAG: nucleotidyltransferase [Ignavibacteria bacterium]